MVRKFQEVYLENQDISVSRPNVYSLTYKELNYFRSSINLLLDKIIDRLEKNKKIVIFSYFFMLPIDELLNI